MSLAACWCAAAATPTPSPFPSPSWWHHHGAGGGADAAVPLLQWTLTALGPLLAGAAALLGVANRNRITAVHAQGEDSAKKVEQVHVLVNSRLSDALGEIGDLHQDVKALYGTLKTAGVPPPELSKPPTA